MEHEPSIAADQREGSTHHEPGDAGDWRCWQGLVLGPGVLRSESELALESHAPPRWLRPVAGRQARASVGNGWRQGVLERLRRESGSARPAQSGRDRARRLPQLVERGWILDVSFAARRERAVVHDDLEQRVFVVGLEAVSEGVCENVAQERLSPQIGLDSPAGKPKWPRSPALPKLNGGAFSILSMRRRCWTATVSGSRTAATVYAATRWEAGVRGEQIADDRNQVSKSEPFDVARFDTVERAAPCDPPVCDRETERLVGEHPMLATWEDAEQDVRLEFGISRDARAVAGGVT